MEVGVKMLGRDFYSISAEELAQGLLGKLLVHEPPDGSRFSGMIVETEAYNGVVDDGSHAYPNRMTERTRIMFGPGGFSYVFFIYGMHSCFNVVAGVEGVPEAVLIRALEPVDGLSEMFTRRKCAKKEGLCNGPGKLCEAMGISREHYGLDLTGKTLFLENYRNFSPQEIGVSPRINIDYAQQCRDWLWRYFVKDSSFVSKVPKRYRTDLTIADL